MSNPTVDQTNDTIQHYQQVKLWNKKIKQNDILRITDIKKKNSKLPIACDTKSRDYISK